MSRREDAAPPMGRQDADAADPGGPDLGAARDGQPPRFAARPGHPRRPVDRTDEPIELPELPVHLEHLVGVLIAKGDGDRFEEGPQVRRIVGRLAELDGVVMHVGILPWGDPGQTLGSSWGSVWAAANRSPRSATRSTMSRIVQRSGRRSGSSSSSQVIGAETGAPGAGRTAYGATSVLIDAFWV